MTAVEQSLFPEFDDPVGPPPAAGEWEPVHGTLYGTGWPCPDCRPVATLWSTPDERDRHHTTHTAEAGQ